MKIEYPPLQLYLHIYLSIHLSIYLSVYTSSGPHPTTNTNLTSIPYTHTPTAPPHADLLATGVLDPAKVTINALENAASIAALVLTTEVLITEIPKKDPIMQAPDPNYV